MQAFRRVFANRRVRNVQIAGAGSTLGIWAYGVALPVYAYHAGGEECSGVTGSHCRTVICDRIRAV